MFEPAFAYVSLTNDFDDVFALLRDAGEKTIEEVGEIAIAKRHPARGPYIIGDQQIAALLAQL